MYPEQRIFLAGIKFAVEFAVVFVSQFRRFLGPCGLGVIDYLVFVGIHVFAVFPFLDLAGDYGHGQETAVFFEQGVDAGLFEEFLVVIVDVEDYVGAAFGLVSGAHTVFGASVALPADGFSIFLIAERTDLNLLCHHECRVEAESEVAYDGIGGVFIFVDEFFSA